MGTVDSYLFVRNRIDAALVSNVLVTKHFSVAEKVDVVD